MAYEERVMKNRDNAKRFVKLTSLVDSGVVIRDYLLPQQCVSSLEILPREDIYHPENKGLSRIS